MDIYYVEKLDNDINVAKEIILSSYDNIIALYLTGSYGHDEGTWIKDKESNITPYNDYDFLVVTNNLQQFDNLDEVRHKIAKRIGIKWIDIDVINLKKLSKLKTTIKNIDLLNGSKLVFGDDVLHNLKPLNAKKIGLYDIEKLYFTRLWCFLGSFEGEFKDLGFEESLFFRNQMVKAILATVDVLLILRHAYTTSYKTRVELIGVDDVDKEYHKLINWAINEKMNPSDQLITKKEMILLYNKTKKYYSLVFGRGFKRFGALTKEPHKTKRLFIFQFRHISRILFNKFVRRTDSYERQLIIYEFQNYVFCAYNNSSINDKYLQIAKEMAKKNFKTPCPSDWFSMKVYAAKIRNGELL